MIHYPLVFGMAATDQSGAICYTDEKGKSQLISKLVDPHAEQLDRNILLRFIGSIQKTDIVVVGRNTYNEMKPLLNTGKCILVSDENGTEEHIHSHSIDSVKPWNPDEDSKQQLLIRAFGIAMRTGAASNIYVLGGGSVYEAFAGHYYQFTHCCFKRSYDVPGKRCIAIKPLTVADREPKHLLESNMPFCRYIDTSMYSVTEYSI